MRYQLYDLQNLDTHTRHLIVLDELAKILKDKDCSICDKPMDEDLDARCSGTNPLTYAHGNCWLEK